MSRLWCLGGIGGFVCALSCVVSVGAFGLPDGRVYELVSPVFKGGYGANNVVAVAPDGESVAFVSLGAFDEDPANNSLVNYYVARRGPSGWSSLPLAVPAALAADSGTLDFSSSLTVSLSEALLPGESYGQASYTGTELLYLTHSLNAPDTVDSFEPVGMPLKALNGKPFGAVYESASDDFCHIVVNSLDPLVSGAGGSRLYELACEGPEGQPALHLIPLNNKAKVIGTCPAELGAESGKDSWLGVVSRTGDRVFFSTAFDDECIKHQVFVRVGDVKTLELSRPQSTCNEVPCGGVGVAGAREPAEFVGASTDGAKVFFLTSASLVGEDKDKAPDVYMAEVGCGAGEGGCESADVQETSLVEVSHAAEPADVQGVVAISPDGSRIYFVARGVLSNAPGPEGRGAVHGADNLYVYDTVNGGAPLFIGDLCSGSELSGEFEDPRCPVGVGTEGASNDTGLWLTALPEAQVNACDATQVGECIGERETGRYLVFSTYGRLTGTDTDSAKDVYRYDAGSGRLDRVSSSEGGYGSNGNNDAFAAKIGANVEHGSLYQQNGLEGRAISDDGSRIVFVASGPLSPHANNGLANAYEWQMPPGGGEGQVALISSGNAGEAVERVVISQSGAQPGNDVFFKTTQGLVPQDTDGLADIYDARLGGGFQPVPQPGHPCSGDACQGPLTNPAPVLVPNTLFQAPGENRLASPTKRMAKKTSHARRRIKKKKKSRRRRAIRGKRPRSLASARTGGRR